MAREFQPQFPPICGWNLSHCSLSSKTLEDFFLIRQEEHQKQKEKSVSNIYSRQTNKKQKENNSSLNQPRLYAKEWESHNIHVGRMFQNMRTNYMRPQWSMIASHPLRHTPDHMLAHEPGVRPSKFLFSGCDARHPTIAGSFLLIVNEKPKGCFLFGKTRNKRVIQSRFWEMIYFSCQCFRMIASASWMARSR